ncbi:MAG: GNAT family N-acetyltransferase [Lachnospiraceae bacterium]|nr:GNAT family N-acetyltransferase [Lachnospiraceae bacterium]
MDLILILGAGAVGKMTVGQELARITDFRLFHNHMMIEPVLELFGNFQGSLISRLRDEIFSEFMKTEYQGLIFTYMMAFDIPSEWEYINSLAERFEKSGGSFFCVELVADQEERLRRNRTENRLKNKTSKRDTELSDSRLKMEDEQYRLVSFEGEIPFEHYLRIDNTNIEASDAAKMIKEYFRLPDRSARELLRRVSLQEVKEEEIPELYRMQVESFMPLYEKYHDEGSPAIESMERVRRRYAVENRKYYFILQDGARVGAINIGHNDPNEKTVSFISPLFILPRFQNRGIGYAAIQKAFELLPEVTCWKLETILQEPANCHLYEKCGFVRVGEEKVVNEAMTLIDYERIRK